MKLKIMLVCFLAMLLLAGGAAYAQPNGYTLSWWTVDGGGGEISGGGYHLNASIGQPDAGTHSGGGYTLSGGFWGNGNPSNDAPIAIYLPFVKR